MTEGSPGPRRDRSNAERAHGALRSARKALGRDWTKTDERFDFHLAEANVFALLELAEVIRTYDQSVE